MLDRFASKRRLPEAIVLDIENTRDSLPQEFRGRIRNVAVRVQGNEPAVTGVGAAKAAAVSSIVERARAMAPSSKATRT